MTDLNFDQEALRRKNEELAHAYKEKNKKLMQTQELYDKLKRKAMMGQMQHAAEDAVDSNIHSATGLSSASDLNGNDPSSTLYREPRQVYQQSDIRQNDGQERNNMYSSHPTNQSNARAWERPMGGRSMTLQCSSLEPRLTT